MPELTRDDGFVINYQEWGNPDAPPVVLLHGYTADLRSWNQHVDALADDYRVLAMDLRGHGRTTAPVEPAEYTMSAYVDDVRALLDSLAIEVCGLVGSSFGGMVAAQFAVDAPERLAALVLSDCSAAYEDTRYGEEYWAREKAIDANCEYAARYGMSRLGKKLAEGVADEFLRYGLIRRYERLSCEAFLGTARVRRERPNLLPVLRERLTMPVLICAGQRDPVRSASEVMATELPGSRIVSFRDAGHTVPMHRPEDFVDAVVGFLRDVEDGAEIAGRFEV